ncbi:hypothetical protein N9195_01545 [bacterium]|nr:hypothetical protein [bacterium]
MSRNGKQLGAVLELSRPFVTPIESFGSTIDHAEPFRVQHIFCENLVNGVLHRASEDILAEVKNGIMNLPHSGSVAAQVNQVNTNASYILGGELFEWDEAVQSNSLKSGESES